MNLHFEELTGSDGARIGIASLDAEKSLNALSLPMILALGERLDAWESAMRERYGETRKSVEESLGSLENRVDELQSLIPSIPWTR